MKKQGITLTGSGFTIIEVMIVLAVSGLMLASAISLISGRQGVTEFQQAREEVNSSLQQTANQVAIGYYPDIGNVQCRPGPSGEPVFSSGAAGGDSQGSNTGCIYIGRVLQFGVAGAGGNDQYADYVLAGCSFSGCIGTTTQSSSPADAKALAIDQVGTLSYTTGFPTNVTQYHQLLNGLTARTVTYVDASGDPTTDGHTYNTSSIGFLQSFGTTTAGCSGLCSGSQQAQLYALKGGTFGDSQQATLGLIDTPGDLVRAASASICFDSGTTSGQSAVLTIDGDTNSVTLNIAGHC